MADLCHGTVINHSGIATECTEPDCDGLEFPHAYRLDCEAIGCRCDAVWRLAI